MTTINNAAASTRSQTLDRGLLALKYISENPAGVSQQEVADFLGVHRTIAHRLIGTLEYRHLVRRTAGRKIVLAGGLLPMALAFRERLQVCAREPLEQLAELTRATAYLYVQVDDSTVQSVVVALPTSRDVHLVIPEGLMHPLSQGAAGIAILSARPPLHGESDAVTDARRLGYAQSSSAILPNTNAVAVAVPAAVGQPSMSVGIAGFDGAQFGEYIVELIETASRIAVSLGDFGVA